LESEYMCLTEIHFSATVLGSCPLPLSTTQFVPRSFLQSVAWV
jgi:hypothetical protein